MVRLMLEYDGSKAFYSIADRLECMHVSVADDDSLRTFHVPVYFRYGQAAFGAGLLLV